MTKNLKLRLSDRHKDRRSYTLSSWRSQKPLNRILGGKFFPLSNSVNRSAKVNENILWIKHSQKNNSWKDHVFENVCYSVTAECRIHWQIDRKSAVWSVKSLRLVKDQRNGYSDWSVLMISRKIRWRTKIWCREKLN